jgi:hypothetical protein
MISTIVGSIKIRGQGILFLPYKPGATCKCTVLSTGVLMPFQPMAEKASHPVLGTVWSLTARPDKHGGAVKWQRACAAWIGKSGGVLLGDPECCFGKQQNQRQLPSRSPGGNDLASGRRKNFPVP